MSMYNNPYLASAYRRGMKANRKVYWSGFCSGIGFCVFLVLLVIGSTEYFL